MIRQLTWIAFLLGTISYGRTNANANAAVNELYYHSIDTPKLNTPAKIIIDLNDEKQTIHSFGASDSWTAKFIGKWKDEHKKNQVADYLFSMDTLKDGSPKGIGLSLWRFNIGAGSYEQGMASGIPDEWRREECFLTSTGTYDWSKEEGGQWFLTAAKKRNVKYIHGFSVSAPVYFTKDGLAHGAGKTSFNIKNGRMPDYATFLATVASHFKFDYLSPFNEPQWNWGAPHPSQEGSAATNAEMATLTKLLGPKLQLAGATTKIVLGEAAQLNFITTDYNGDRGNQFVAWFDKASANYIGNVPNVEKAVSGHSYFTTCPDSNLVAIRKALTNKKDSVDPSLGIWQTEFGILGDICGNYNGFPRNTSIDYGLYVAKVIHHDLAVANVNSWSWWLAVSPYDYSDALVYINDPADKINVAHSKNDGIVHDSRQLWCMGNFSAFIRPGMKRIAASVNGIDDTTAGSSYMVSSYKDSGTKKLVIVIINMTNSSKNFAIESLRNPIHIRENKFDVYTTTANKNLAHTYVASDNITVEPKCVTTLTGTYE